MKVNVNSIRTLYRAGKITTDGVTDAYGRGWITLGEYAGVLRDGVMAGKLTDAEAEKLIGS